MSNKLKQDAEQAEKDGDFDLAHSLYSMLTARCKRMGNKVLSDLYNDKANIYADDAESVAVGCRLHDDEE